MKTITTLIGSLGLLLYSMVATAGHISCSPAETDAFVAGSVGCSIGHTNNDFLNPLQVNEDRMFGYDDWAFGLRFDYDIFNFEYGASDYSIWSGVTANGERTSSQVFLRQSLEDLYPELTDAMIVIKGSKGNTTQPNYVGYALDLTVDSFAMTTPFFNPVEDGLGNPKGMSHWTLYGRGSDTFATSCTGEDCDITEVPEPSSIALFGLAGAGLIFARRRKIAQG